MGTQSLRGPRVNNIYKRVTEMIDTGILIGS